MDASRWILTSRRFRICVGQVGRGCFRPSYGRLKFTLFSKKITTKMSRYKKQARPQFSKYRFQNKSALAHNLWEAADLIWNQYFENCGHICSLWHLIFLLTDCIWLHSPDFRWQKQGHKKFVPPFHIQGVPERVPFFITVQIIQMAQYSPLLGYKVVQNSHMDL